MYIKQKSFYMSSQFLTFLLFISNLTNYFGQYILLHLYKWQDSSNLVGAERRSRLKRSGSGKPRTRNGEPLVSKWPSIPFHSVNDILKIIIIKKSIEFL